MRKTYRLLFALLVAATSLSSCSRSTYSFNTDAPAYLGAAQARVSTPVATANVATETPAIADATLPSTGAPAARRPARTHRATAAHVATTTEVVAPVSTAEPMQLAKLDRKALKQEVKRQLAAAPKEIKADGKSQTTALILCILLGGIGVHQFYLGYTGRGILRIALALTSFLIIPAIVNLVLYILDIIKIVNGTLKPRDGEYGEKFNK